jgi:hypothetical protein
MQALEQQSLLFEHFPSDGVHPAAILVLGRRVTAGVRSLRCKNLEPVSVAAITNRPSRSVATAAACVNPAAIDSSIAITKLVATIDIRFILDTPSSVVEKCCLGWVSPGWLVSIHPIKVPEQGLDDFAHIPDIPR